MKGGELRTDKYLTRQAQDAIAFFISNSAMPKTVLNYEQQSKFHIACDLRRAATDISPSKRRLRSCSMSLVLKSAENRDGWNR